jgi:hypothetical protein
LHIKANYDCRYKENWRVGHKALENKIKLEVLGQSEIEVIGGHVSDRPNLLKTLKIKGFRAVQINTIWGLLAPLQWGFLGRFEGDF